MLNKYCGYSGAQAEQAFRRDRDIADGSLPGSSVDKLARRLGALSGGNPVLEGCPTP
ncbi:MAG: hypothetical protein AB7F86_02680 [Bdellovibrionales bacterium]